MTITAKQVQDLRKISGAGMMECKAALSESNGIIDEAFKILRTSPDKLKLISDYYKAVFHLANYPGRETEDLLLKLIGSKANDQSIAIAKRKAVEVLAILDKPSI